MFQSFLKKYAIENGIRILRHFFLIAALGAHNGWNLLWPSEIIDITSQQEAYISCQSTICFKRLLKQMIKMKILSPLISITSSWTFWSLANVKCGPQPSKDCWFQGLPKMFCYLTPRTRKQPFPSNMQKPGKRNYCKNNSKG